jgi:ParB-like chromosome segregation protein Spo0J
MESKIIIVKNSLIKEHEMIIASHMQELAGQIKSDGFILYPIIVDARSMVILDGHHRFNAIKSLGLRFSPVRMVDYSSQDISVTSWREGEAVDKAMVIEAGLSGKRMRPKTSRHSIAGGQVQFKVLLDDLI